MVAFMLDFGLTKVTKLPGLRMSGTSQNKPKSSQQNYLQQKQKRSDIALFSIDKNTAIDMVTS